MAPVRLARRYVKRPIFAAMPLLLSLTVVACAIEPSLESSGETETQELTSADALQRDSLQAQANEFMRSIIERDVAALDGIVSSEIEARAHERGMDLGAFLEKEREALMRTFELADGVVPEFEVANVTAAGNAVRVTLRLDGEELKKPFYFVREGSAYKLNIAPPGFSRAGRENSLLGKSNYQVHNVNVPGNASFTLECYQGGSLPFKSITVAPQQTKKVACEDACGFWAGTQFGGPDGHSQWCDWNAWGDDVIINLLAPHGWFCDDYC